MVFSYVEINADIIKLIYHEDGKNKYSKKIFTFPKFLIDITQMKNHKSCSICKEAKDIINKVRKK